MSHAWFAGGESSDSERTLAVGGLAIVPLTVLDGFTYSALGHIHKPGAPAHNIRYSGSPMKFSFSETNHTKNSLLVDISRGNVEVTEIPTPVWREMADISGTLDELLTLDKFNDVQDHWVRANLLEIEIPANAMERLRVRFPNIIKLKLPALNSEVGPDIDVETVDPVDLCCHFIEFTRGETKPVSKWEKEQLNKAVQHASVAIHAESVTAPTSEASA
jgi:exonuclease SbcD